MNRRTFGLLVLWTAAFLAVRSFAGDASEERPPLQCDVGPVTRVFGGTDWLVYSCNDGDSFVVVSARGNPAMPFYFMVTKKDGKRSVRGEGNGDKAASGAAFEELRSLIESEQKVQDMLRATKSVEAQ